MSTENNHRVIVAANRSSGTGRGHRAVERTMAALRTHGIDAELLEAPSYAQLQLDVADRISAGVRALVVVGGDGMVHLGFNAVATTNTPLGVVPAGTGNDFARMLGLDARVPEIAVERIARALDSAPRAVDAALVTGAFGSRYVAGVFSAGFDAVVNERANAMSWPRGAQRYNLALLRELLAFKPRRYVLSIDGGAEEQLDAMLISVANAQFIGGGMRIVPQASITDGLLDLVVIAPLGKLRFLGIFPSVFSGKHITHPAVRIEQVRSLTLRAADTRGFGDGEAVGALPVEVTAAPGVVKLLF
ncbi:diacylglycerol/lipid kinase family protein [Paeniglutamicibacter sp. NPDC091659]|uniref:diacylglycerol/lipid kinase family protein n=1 Tax=Paeniglutamicibacter sp. NPDC091659 TaxID=3364389 RepID=UPI0037F16494